jgi:riboflavin transporter FmnP
MRSNEIKKITVTAMLTSVAFLATLLTSMFKVGGFLSMDLKDAVISIIALLYGPLYGIISVLTVSLIEFITISTTGLYGLVMNIVSSGTFAIVCGFVYKYKRNFIGAIFSSIGSVVAVTSLMLIANIFITPLYFQMPKAAVIDMIPTLLLPFNFFKSTLNASLMLLVYKPFTTVLRKAGLLQEFGNSSYKFGIKSLVLSIVSIVLIVFSVYVLVLL